MRGWPAIALIVLSASLARADQADPYFHAIYCKAVWGALAEEEKGRIAGSSAALAAIQKILDGYVGSGAKSPRAIEADIGDLKAYSNFGGDHFKDWKGCVRFYAP